MSYQPRYLTPKEYAARMRVSERNVTRLCKAGRVHGAEQIGKLWRIPNPDYEINSTPDLRIGKVEGN